MCLLRISQEMTKGMNFLITTITIDNWNSFSQADMVVSPHEKGAGRETMGKVSADGERS
jgi:hypothetical protein